MNLSTRLFCKNVHKNVKYNLSTKQLNSAIIISFRFNVIARSLVWYSPSLTANFD